MAVTLIGQVSALLYRSSILQLRQIKTNIFQILLPVLCMLVLIVMNSMLKSAQENNNNNNNNNNNGGSSSDSNDNSQSSSNQYQIWFNNQYNITQIMPNYLWFTNPTNGQPVSTFTNDTQYYPTSGLLTYFPYQTTTLYADNGTYITWMFPFWKEIDPSNQATVDQDVVAQFAANWDVANDQYRYNLSIAPPAATLLFDAFQSTATNTSLSYTLENYAVPLQASRYYSQVFMYGADNSWQYINYVTNAVLKMVGGYDYFIDTYNSAFQVQTTINIMIVVDLMSAFMIPSMFTFIFPVFVHNLVFEKEQKLFQVMAMMGLKNSVYTFANQLFYVFLYLIIMAILSIMGFASQIDFFAQQGGKFLLLSFMYGLALISMAFLFSSFFWKAKTSSILSYLLVIITPTIGTVIDIFVFSGKPAPIPFLFYPPFAFCHGLSQIFLYLNGNGYSEFNEVISLSDPSSQFSQVIIALFLETIIFYILGIYCNNVIPKQFGNAYSPFYPIHDLRDWIKGRNTGSTSHEEKTSLIHKSHSINVHDIIEEDKDCRVERENANSSNNYLLKAINVKKTYKTGSVVKEALVNFCLTSKEGEILGLLGPNGAGKTTFIHIIGGMYAPTSGNIYINGYNILDQMDTIYQFLGFCPQHDILYEDLTIYQHLKFYSKLKGLYNTSYEREQNIDKILSKVKLLDEKNKRITQLSGGMKRRVSISISILGDNKLVLLDEPTTGLDPGSRRDIWDIIESIKQDKTVLITTHNMEEADALCSKIAIVANGQLQCVGSPIYLKNRYGKGFRLDIVPESEHFKDSLIQMVNQTFPDATQEESMNETLTFLIPRECDISIIFDLISQNKQKLGIREWGVSQSSLEEVFLTLSAAQNE
ncbi:hypothetical protein DFA_03791 [Cavenderia fasciculata]|uniref:ABC transporter domain-containing protein n=1 Tax=Cavenderia fasciculata TaxID=261658 RepID=F4Q0E6_CACFS|nr:uncharacterized protein DFA_03791 [Cavenderia fasciculata]EGG18297.1 hypothetical protein DFA_03791 [Cavenderia fasciculata]|eukprot:XP_004357120.1 hypothetical protein DFA_03791 [Cavenderia fasciculata]